MDNQVSTSLGANTIPYKVRVLAEALSKIHGPVIIRSEQNGLHIYMASPKALEQDGDKELFSKHLTVNASRYFRLGEHIGISDIQAEYSSLCHKTGTKYRITDLLNMESLNLRGQSSRAPSVTTLNVASKDHMLTEDDKGNKVPFPPGSVIYLASGEYSKGLHNVGVSPRSDPIALQHSRLYTTRNNDTQLHLLHAAYEYLHARQANLEFLHTQFKVSVCYEELPEDKSVGRMYRRLDGGFKDTPQGRIIFYAFVNNVCVGWQARYLEKTEFCKDTNTETKFIFHPYFFKWVPLPETTAAGTGSFSESADLDEGPKSILRRTTATNLVVSEDDRAEATTKFKISKYKTAFGMSRSTTLMGYDAAVAWNEKNGTATAVLVEGPLDAGRIGPPGMAMLGKYLNDGQALLLKKFKRVIIVADNDKAGLEALNRAKHVFSNIRTTEFISVSVPEIYKDLGAMPEEEALKLLQPLYI